MNARRVAYAQLLVAAVLFDVMSSVVVLGEAVRWQIAVGGVIVLAGPWLVQRLQAAAPVPAAQEAQSRA